MGFKIDICTHEAPVNSTGGPFVWAQRMPLEFKKSINIFLDENPSINGLFVTISKSYLVVDAIKDRKEKITFIGYDLVEKNITYLQEGKIDFIIHQNLK